MPTGVYVRHKSVKRSFPKPKGSASPNWKGGITSNRGWKIIKMPEHHRADKRGYVRLHVVIYEQHHNLCLLRWSDVNHINGIQDDNRIENLQAMMHGHHQRWHRLRDWKSGKYDPKKIVLNLKNGKKRIKRY